MGTPTTVVGQPTIPAQRAKSGPGWRSAEDGAEAWALVAAVQAGDREAFGLLYTRYEPQVRAFFRRQVRDHHLVDDLTSETFLRILRRINAASDRDVHIIVWIMLNARSVLSHHWDRAHVRREVATDVLPEPTSGSGAPGSPECEVLAQIEREAVGAAICGGLDQLCASQRRCVELYDLDGLPVAEVTAVLGRTDQAVYSMRKRARYQLADALDPGGQPGTDRYARATHRAHTDHHRSAAGGVW